MTYQVFLTYWTSCVYILMKLYLHFIYINDFKVEPYSSKHFFRLNNKSGISVDVLLYFRAANNIKYK